MSTPPSIDTHLHGLVDACGERERMVAPRVRAFVEEAREYLADLHRRTRSGRQVNEANSDLVDRLVRRLFSLAEESLLADGGTIERGLCVVAVGGYARREMSIHSDVDLLILYRGGLSPYVASIVERLQYWLWDAGLTVGCATRTIEETVGIGRKDVTVRTAVLTARFLCGDGEFFHDFADAIRRELLPEVGAFIDEQIENRAARHTSYGESLFLLQPNVKEGAGGLRDYHSAYWVARGSQPSIRDLDDLLHFGLLTEPEMKAYREALGFLWHVRNQLHLTSKRCNDQLSFELQEEVAEFMDYGSSDDEPSENSEHSELPVERFMRDYYTHARAIRNFSELVIEQCVSRARPEERDDVPRQVEHGFIVRDERLQIPHAAYLRAKPIRLLEAFQTAQAHGVPLSRLARRLIRENLDCVDDAVRRDPECSTILMEILDSEQRVMRTLVDMNEVGLLAAFLPEWEHIVCRWQHVLYHTYTVDVHSIFLVEELRRLWRGKYQAAMPELTELMREVDDRPALFLGCLLHDIGKGFGGNHSDKGVVRAKPCVERLGLSEERVQRVLFLVQNHLLMSHLAQSRDLSDSKMVLDFARLCGDRRNLRDLYLLTFADTRASSAEAWNEWRGQLLRDLFERASEFLETGTVDSEQALELVERRVGTRRARAKEELQRLGIGEIKIDAYFEGMPRRYFITHNPAEIARHAQVALRFAGEQPFSSAFRETDDGSTEFIICTRDVHALYSLVAGSLAACGMNILSSNVYTSRSGLALEVYRVRMPAGGRDVRERECQRLEETLARVLTGEVGLEELLARRRNLRTKKTRPPLRSPAKVVISNDESDFYSLVEVTADDRIGLLSDLAGAIGRHDFEIYVSKVATIRDQITDTFYIKDAQGKKIRDLAALDALRESLQAVVDRGDEVSGA